MGESEDSGNTSDVDVEQRLLGELAGGDSVPDVTLPDVALRDVTVPDVALPNVALTNVTLPDDTLSEEQPDGSVREE